MAPALNRPKTVSQGDVFSLRFPVTDAATKGPATYTAPVASFAMAPGAVAIDGATPVIEKDSAAKGGVRIVQEAGSWVVYVDFVEADTKANPAVKQGQHYYELMIEDGPQRDTVATGALVVNLTIIP